MNIKYGLFILSLISLNCVIQAKSLLKRFHDKEFSLSLDSGRIGEKALNVLARSRRSAEEIVEHQSSAEPTDEEAMALFKFFVNVAWQEDKLSVLGGLLDELVDEDTNVTLVGWQRIRDDQGRVKEINTIQLVIPPRPEKKQEENSSTDQVDVFDDKDDHDDEDDDVDEGRAIPHHKLNELKEIFEPLEQLGIPASITLEEHDKEGELETLLHLSKNTLYVKSDGFVIYNKTTIVQPEEVSDFIKHLKPSILGKPSILKYDVDGHLNLEHSHIEPHIWGSLLEQYEAPDDVIISGPEIIAQISQQYSQEEIPKHLVEHYNKAHPDYTWRVLVNPGSYYVTRDVYVQLTYDNFDLDEASDITYLVFGVKKSGHKK